MAHGDPEVAESEDTVPAEDEVLRLDVPMHETRGVGRGERGAGLHAEPRHLGRRQPALPCEKLGERLALHVLHRDEGTAVILAHVEDAHDVRVREPRGQAGLTNEAPPQVIVPGEVLGQPLECDRPIELDVVHEIDGRHRPVTQRPSAHPSFPCLSPGLW